MLGRDGKFILMAQTGRHFCVHPRHLLKVNKGNKQKDKNEINQVIRKKDIHKNGSLKVNIQH